MVQLTPRLKAYAVKYLGVDASAHESKFRVAVANAIKAGTMTAETLQKLTSVKAVDVANDVLARVVAGRKTAPTAPRRTAPTPAPVAPPAVDIQAEIKKGVAEVIKGLNLDRSNPTASSVGPEALLSKANQVRVKSAAESYSRTTKAAIYPERTGRNQDGTRHLLAGQRASVGGVPLDEPSQLDKAVAGSFFKWCINRQAGIEVPRKYRMTDHENDLMAYAIHEMPWTGLMGGAKDSDYGKTYEVNRAKLSDFHVKALLDDSTSGGIEAAPIAFDDAIVIIPVLYGEFFPLVNVINVARGRRMKGALMQNPTFTSGIAEGTAIMPFNTSAFVSAFDTAIFPAVGAMEIGLDFEEDSPVDMGSQIIENYGLKALEWLDRVIVTGDGVTEPQGVFNATGTTTVNSDSGPGGPLTVSDLEGLYFGVAKQFRNEAGAVPIFAANDTMYRRVRSINVGPGDERRVFGLTHGDYTILDRPFKINNYLTNGKMGFFNAKRYRMYRRLGLNVRIETAGSTLARSNTRLIVLRLRFGAQLETGGAAAIMLDAQS